MKIVVRVDHDFRHRRIVDQVFQRAQADGLIEHLLASLRGLIVLGSSENSRCITSSISLIVALRSDSSSMLRTSSRRRSICLTSEACSFAR